jgi:hypothetical protein
MNKNRYNFIKENVVNNLIEYSLDGSALMPGGNESGRPRPSGLSPRTPPPSHKSHILGKGPESGLSGFRRPTGIVQVPGGSRATSSSGSPQQTSSTSSSTTSSRTVGGIPVGGIPTASGLKSSAAALARGFNPFSATNIIQAGVGYPVADYVGRKTDELLTNAGIENEDARWIASNLTAMPAGSAAGAAAAAIPSVLAGTSTPAAVGTAALGGAAAGGAAAAGMLGGWYAARGLLHGYDKLTGSDMTQQKTNPVDIAADYLHDTSRHFEDKAAEEQRLAREKSTEAKRRKEEMAMILRGETPPPRIPGKVP